MLPNSVQTLPILAICCTSPRPFSENMLSTTASSRIFPHISLGSSSHLVQSYSYNPRSYSSMLVLCANDSWSARSLPFPWNHFHSNDNASAASFVLVLGMVTGGFWVLSLCSWNTELTGCWDDNFAAMSSLSALPASATQQFHTTYIWTI